MLFTYTHYTHSRAARNYVEVSCHEEGAPPEKSCQPYTQQEALVLFTDTGAYAKLAERGRKAYSLNPTPSPQTLNPNLQARNPEPGPEPRPKTRKIANARPQFKGKAHRDAQQRKSKGQPEAVSAPPSTTEVSSKPEQL